MSHSRVIGFLAFALCLVASWSASAEVKATPITLQEATTAVNAAKKSAEEVFDKAQGKVNKAKPVLARLEAFATEAKNTEGMAAEAELKVLKEAKDNKDARDIVNNIKSISLKVNTFITTAKKNLNTADTNLTIALQTATTLKTESNIEIPDTDTAEGLYSAIANTASGLKLQVENVDNNIIAAINIINEETSTADNVEKSLKEAQVANLHLSVIVAVAKIDAMIGKADGILTNTQNQKDEVNGIVQNMQKHCTTDLVDSYEIIKEQCNSADGELIKAKAAAEKSKNAMAAIKEQKGLADTALENVQKPETVLSAAEEEVRKADECVSAVQQRLLHLQSALQTDENYVTKAKDSEQKLVAALSTTTTKPNTEQITATENADPPVGDGTELGQKDPTIQPTSKDSTDQSNNSTDKLKDKLIKGAQNVPTTALTGGKAPAPGAKNDSAMTVSVPLFVALIASAVLQ